MYRPYPFQFKNSIFFLYYSEMEERTGEKPRKVVGWKREGQGEAGKEGEEGGLL